MIKSIGLKQLRDALEKGSPFRKTAVIGIDLGTTSIKAAQFERRGEGLALSKLDLKEIAAVDPALREKEILAVLKKLLQGVNLKQASFAVSFNGPEVGLRALAVPPMPKAELIQAVKLESHNYFPFPLENALIDVETCGSSLEKGLKKEQVILAAAPRKRVEEILSLLKKLGIQPASLTPVPYALQKFAAAFKTKANQIQCLMDLGESCTEFVILKGEQLVFSRKIPVTARDFTQALTEALVSVKGKTQLSQEEAEKLKREVGIPAQQEGPVVETLDEKITGSQISMMLRAPMEQLVSEIERCFHYYQEQVEQGEAGSLILTGRGGLLKGIGSALSEGLGIQVTVWNSPEGLEIDGLERQSQKLKLKEELAAFAPALGAALSQGQGINLLPPEIKEQTQRAFKRSAVQSAVLAGLLLLVFVYLGMRIQLGNFEKRISVAELEKKALQYELERVRSQIVVHNILADEPYWEDVFNEIGSYLPSGAKLTGFISKNKTLLLKGLIASPEKEAVLSDFISDLEKGIFKNVKLVTARETDDGSASEFEIESLFD